MSVSKLEFEKICKELGLNITPPKKNNFKSYQECFIFMQRFSQKKKKVQEVPYKYKDWDNIDG